MRLSFVRIECLQVPTFCCFAFSQTALFMSECSSSSSSSSNDSGKYSVLAIRQFQGSFKQFPVRVFIIPSATYSNWSQKNCITTKSLIFSPSLPLFLSESAFFGWKLQRASKNKGRKEISQAVFGLQLNERNLILSQPSLLYLYT